MKDILNEVISRLSTKKTKFCRLKHKRGWLEFLQDGDLIFTPAELHACLRQVIDAEDKRPRGEKLFSLRRKTTFTIRENKRPYRPEEALERFIVISNPDNLYNQIPIGGRKESIDIGIEEAAKFVFVELKPWQSSDSPLYAIVESLKNLIEYRLIHELNIKEIPGYSELELCILAPEEYYRTYRLVNDHGARLTDNMSILKRALDNLSSEFNASLSIMALHLEMNGFLDVCRKLYDRERISGQSVVSVTRKDAIPSLKRENWELKVTST